MPVGARPRCQQARDGAEVAAARDEPVRAAGIAWAPRGGTAPPAGQQIAGDREAAALAPRETREAGEVGVQPQLAGDKRVLAAAGQQRGDGVRAAAAGAADEDGTLR